MESEKMNLMIEVSLTYINQPEPKSQENFVSAMENPLRALSNAIEQLLASYLNCMLHSKEAIIHIRTPMDVSIATQSWDGVKQSELWRNSER